MLKFKANIKVMLFAVAIVCGPAVADVLHADVGEPIPVGVLKSRSHTVEIFTSGGESVYTVHAQGVTVAEKLPLASLRKQVPEAYELLSSGVARDASLSRDLVVPDTNSRF